MNDCLNDFEHYLHQARHFDPLVDAFLVHYQFEAIHPFRDGNGRVGRLLLALTIKEWCDLDDQWLYMSAYFDANKDTYIDTLFRISTHGAWKEWIEFCLIGVREQSRDAANRCQQLLDLARDYDIRLGRIKGSYRLNTIVDHLFTRPIVQIPEVATNVDVTYPTAKSDVEKLVDVGILEELEEITPRTFFAKEIYNITYAD